MPLVHTYCSKTCIILVISIIITSPFHMYTTDVLFDREALTKHLHGASHKELFEHNHSNKN